MRFNDDFDEFGKAMNDILDILFGESKKTDDKDECKKCEKCACDREKEFDRIWNEVEKCSKEEAEYRSKIKKDKGPDYYTNNGKSTISTEQFIHEQELNFNLGNVVKYVCRAGRKDPGKTIEDLKKARNYLKFEIDHLEKGE